MLLSNPKFYFIALTISPPPCYMKNIEATWLAVLNSPRIGLRSRSSCLLFCTYILAIELSSYLQLLPFSMLQQQTVKGQFMWQGGAFSRKKGRIHIESFFGNRAKIRVLIWSCLLELGREISKNKKTCFTKEKKTATERPSQSANPLFSAVSQPNLIKLGVCEVLPKDHHHFKYHQHCLENSWEKRICRLRRLFAVEDRQQ